MDAKEIKTALKNARESIKNKDFKEALRQCKSVLASDKTNYNALVFVGVAAEGMEQADQALKAYKKATETAPDQILAWQGLCGFYEKNPTAENNADLVKVYKKLADLQAGDKEKKMQILTKLAQLLGKCGNPIEAVDVYQSMLKGDGTERGKLLKEIFNLLNSQKSLSPEHQKLMLETCQKVLMDDVTPEDSERVLKQYLQLLIKQDARNKLTEECKKLKSKFPKSTVTMETCLLMLLEELIECETEASVCELKEMSENLSALSPTSCYVVLSQGVLLLLQGKPTDARSLLQQGTTSLPRVACGYVFLARCYEKLHSNSACVEVCKKGLSVVEKKDRVLTVPSKTVCVPLHLMKASCLYRMGSPRCLAQAVDILTKFGGVLEESKALLINIYLKQGNIEEAELQLKSTAGSYKDILTAKVLFHKGEYQEALTMLERLTETRPGESEPLYMLGRVLWEMRDNPEVEGARDRCFKAFLKAAKLDPYNSEIFLYLGHFYCIIQKDNMKAKRCFQKSYDLDPGNEEAGAALCDILVAVREDAEAKKLLENATGEATPGSGKWAWLRLGLYQVKHEDPSVAVASFQSALRADPRDNHAWECLAEAYLHRGSYTAALKTFTKAAELDPDSVYSLFQMASIKQTLGEFPEAVAEYKLILEKSQDYVPALKGLGETLLLLARQHLDTCLDGLARDRCQESLAYLTRAASQRPDLSCLWKLMGDACSILHPLATQTFRMDIPAKLVQQSKTSQETVSVGQLQLLQVGARCYGKALKSIPESASLWHDLGVNYFHQSELSSTNAAELAQKAMQSLKKAISLDQTNFRHWNALGVVVCSKDCYKPSLAQHCFIKSVEAESNNVVAWTNLGTLYLKNDNVGLAHEAFKVAQSLDPNYVACWIGQALIAEVVGHDDAMDLFRHTTELGNHLEGAVGYGSWVCGMLQDQGKRNTELFQYCIKQMAAIPAASDALARYTGRVKTDATAYNMYGLLLEHQDLYKMAADAFRSALDILEKGPSNDEVLNKVKINYGRVLCKGGNYAESVSEFKKVGTLEACEDLCFLGQACYKLGEFQDSFQAYNSALSKADSDEDKSHIYSALGMVAYKFGDMEGAKSALFSSSQLSKPSAIGLEALCALGLLQSDATLAMAAIQELFKLGDKDPSLPDTTWLSAAIQILQGNIEVAKRSIQKVILKQPSSSRLWSILSAILVQYFPHLGLAASQCARAAQQISHHEDKTAPTLLTLGQLQGGQHSRKNMSNNALKLAQRTLHAYPGQTSNKCSLSAALHAEAVLSDLKRRSTYLQLEQRYLQCVLDEEGIISPNVTLWSQRQKVVSLILSGKLDEAKEVMKQVSSLQDGSSVFSEVMQAAISGDISGVQGKVGQQGRQLYLWQVLTEMYIQQGLVGEADTSIRQTLQLAQADSPRQLQLETLLKLASLAYQQIMSGSGDRDTMRSVFNEAAEEVLKIDPRCSAVLLMMGALSIKNNKTSRKHYQKALDAGSLRSSRGHDVSLARRAIIRNILYSQKDLPLAEELAGAAESDGDEETVKLYRDLKGED